MALSSPLMTQTTVHTVQIEVSSSDLSDTPDAPLALIVNSYLDDLSANVRSRPIPWEGYQRASLISESELAMIQNYEKQSKEGRAQLLKGHGQSYVNLFINLLNKLGRVDTIQYILLMIDDMLSDDAWNAQIFHALREINLELPFHPFLKLLRKEDEYTALKSSKILTFLFCSATESLPDDNYVSEYFSWLTTQLSNSNLSIVDLAVQNLMAVLAVVDLRKTFFYNKNGAGVQGLMDILKKSNPTPQMQYQVTFCLWLLTFENSVAAEINKKFDIIQPILDTARSSIKEKVIRVTLATFRNLLSKAPEENVPAMVGNKIPNFLETLSQRKFSDHEIVDDLEYLKEKMRESVLKLSSFEEYSAEVRSGRLEWSPAHTSEQFWKQNADKLNQKDYELLRILARILVTSTLPLILSVAAYDLGQYVKYCPQGKKLLQEIGAKQRIMELMGHENSDVRYQALIAVQKYMVNAWEF